VNEKEIEQKLIAAYDNMMSRLNALLHDAEEQALPVLISNLDKVKKQAIELSELTHEEADKLGYYIQRDLHDAAEHLEHTGEQLSTWLRFDIELVEDRVLELFSKVADKTRLELTLLAEQAKHAQDYHTGEITSIGTLSCSDCGTLMHFKKTSRIPPCPKCHKTLFTRVKTQ
jgi:NADH pyrophosphatase NudC (nudix superfamily)